jgi:hypothetical protein
VSTAAPRAAQVRSSQLGSEIEARERALASDAGSRSASARWTSRAQQGNEMARSERMAALCDVTWRRQHGQEAAPGRTAPALTGEGAAHVACVVAHLDVLAPLWHALPVDQELVFEWPDLLPNRR